MLLPSLAEGDIFQKLPLQITKKEVNAIIQGSASDIIKHAMIDVDSSILSIQPLHEAVSAVKQRSAPTDVSSAAHLLHINSTLRELHQELSYCKYTMS